MLVLRRELHPNRSEIVIHKVGVLQLLGINPDGSLSLELKVPFGCDYIRFGRGELEASIEFGEVNQEEAWVNMRVSAPEFVRISRRETLPGGDKYKEPVAIAGATGGGATVATAAPDVEAPQGDESNRAPHEGDAMQVVPLPSHLDGVQDDSVADAVESVGDDWGDGQRYMPDDEVIGWR